MKTLRLASIVALLLGACDFAVPNLNQPGIESLQSPTPSQVNALATGLLIGARKGVTERVGVIVEWGVLGREALVLTPSDPRFINQLLAGPFSAGDANFGGDFWVIPYANIRGANLLLHALDNPALVGLTDAQKQAARGFAKTIKAVDYLQVFNSHYTNGMVLDVDHPLGDPPGAIVTSTDQILTFLEALLDDAQTNLAAGGTAFSFKLGTGFAGFDTPANFLTFNRALRARVAVYHGKFNDALTALGLSFIDPATPGGTPTTTLGAWPGVGVFHAYGAGSGDTANDLNDTSIFCHDSTVTDAEAGDLRVAQKVKTLATAFTLTNHSSSHAFTIYPSSTSPIPIIRNEELILLRAEANIGLALGAGGTPAQLSAAKADIDYVRVNSGGLPPRCPSLGVGTCTPPAITSANILDELLKQKRYSLLFEGGHRWIDLRRYGKLDAAHVSVDQPGDVIHPAFPIPITETEVGH